MVVTVTYKILQVSSMILGCHKVSQDFETDLARFMQDIFSRVGKTVDDVVLVHVPLAYVT